MLCYHCVKQLLNIYSLEKKLNEERGVIEEMLSSLSNRASGNSRKRSGIEYHPLATKISCHTLSSLQSSPLNQDPGSVPLHSQELPIPFHSQDTPGSSQIPSGFSSSLRLSQSSAPESPTQTGRSGSPSPAIQVSWNLFVHGHLSISCTHLKRYLCT